MPSAEITPYKPTYQELTVLLGLHSLLIGRQKVVGFDPEKT
jgi:hypothetical protein